MPLSEDALCIFMGSVLPLVWKADPILRTKLILALYFGIVVSDAVTFSIGKIMGKGLLEPIRQKFDIRSQRIDFCEDDNKNKDQEGDDDDNIDYDDIDDIDIEGLSDEEYDLLIAANENEFCEIATDELRSKDKALAILEDVGNYAGFVIRFCIGMRLPMMLATGLSGKVPFLRYILGSAAGAAFSLSAQLLLGFVLKDNPALIIASVGGISTFPLLIPTLVAFGGWVNVAYKRWSMYNNPRQTTSS